MHIMDFQPTQPNIQAPAPKLHRLRPVSVAAWLLWVVVTLVWAASLVPFYSRGMHLYPSGALITAGHVPPYVPVFSDIYGTSSAASFAFTIITFAPCFFGLALIGVFSRLLAFWHTYSTPGLVLRMAAFIATALLVVQSLYMAGTFVTWGLD